MTLNAFHKLFIAVSILCLTFAARWASGHNAAMLSTPWLRAVSVAGLVLLTPYFVWKVVKS
jgi:hypothetical protein